MPFYFCFSSAGSCSSSYLADTSLEGEGREPRNTTTFCGQKLSVDKNAMAKSTIARNPLWLNVNIKFAHKNNTREGGVDRDSAAKGTKPKTKVNPVEGKTRVRRAIKSWLRQDYEVLAGCPRPGPELSIDAPRPRRRKRYIYIQQGYGYI